MTEQTTLVEKAIAAGTTDSKTIAKLAELESNSIALKAKQEFNLALSKAQGEIPIIHKGRKGHNSTYAGYDDIMKAVAPILSDNGLSVRFSTEQRESALSVQCIISHSSGHHESSSLTIPVDSRMSANDSQKVGSANSYARRYAIMNALNIVVSEDDDDGQSAGTETISPSEVAEIKNALKDTQSDTEGFLKFCKCDSVEEIPKSKLAKVRQTLAAKKKEVAK